MQTKYGFVVVYYSEYIILNDFDVLYVTMWWLTPALFKVGERNLNLQIIMLLIFLVIPVPILLKNVGLIIVKAVTLAKCKCLKDCLSTENWGVSNMKSLLLASNNLETFYSRFFVASFQN